MFVEICKGSEHFGSVGGVEPFDDPVRSVKHRSHYAADQSIPVSMFNRITAARSTQEQTIAWMGGLEVFYLLKLFGGDPEESG